MIDASEYVRSSPARLQIFKDFAKEDKMSTKNCLSKWMFQHDEIQLLLCWMEQLSVKKTFERLEEHDLSYLLKDDIPTAEDWNNAKVFVIKVFYIYVCDFKHISSRTLLDPKNNS